MPAIRVQLQEQDYVNAAHAAAAPSARGILTLAAVSALVLLVLVVAWRAGYSREAFLATFTGVFALTGAVIGHKVTISRRAKEVFRQQHGLRKPHELLWDERGVTIAAEDSRSSVPWADFHKYRELDDQFVLFLSDAMFFMVPKRAFPDGSLADAFRRVLQDRIEGRTERHSR